MADQLYTIHCLYGAPLSTWDDPATETEILDRYYDQYLDQSNGDDILKREEFTRELFEDVWECRLIEV